MIDIINNIESQKIISVLEIENIDSIDFVCDSLVKGGIKIIELALRTSVSKSAASIIKNRFPEITIGLGTVINIDQIKFALDYGIDFAVSPGTNPKIIDYSLKNDLPFFPGVSCPTDIEIAVDNGCNILKFYPAQKLGGIDFLKSINDPYKYLGLKYIPMGGINFDNCNEYLKSDIVLGIGGSWIASKNLIKSCNWDVIKKNAEALKKSLI